MRSSHGEIEVFLCPDDPGVKSPLTSAYTAPAAPQPKTEVQLPEVHQQHLQHHQQPTPVQELPQEYINHNVVDVKAEALHPTDNALAEAEQTILSTLNSGGMRDALLCESDDFGIMGGGRLQLQTEDQYLTSGMFTIKSFFFFFSSFDKSEFIDTF